MASFEITGRDPCSGLGRAVRVEDGRIASVREVEGAHVHSWLSAGLVDLQVNGYAGHDLNADPLGPSHVTALAHALHRHGTTTFLPTLITASEALLGRRLQAIAQARESDPLVAHSIPCVHLEGPSVSDQDGPRGAHPRTQVRAPDIAEFERLQQACGGLVRMVTLSPHWDDSAKYIRELVARGVRVCIGHTSASPEQIRDAVDAGASLSTHLGNGSAALMHRHRNALWTQLADDRLWASFIADGHHLPADAFKAMLRAKTPERSVLVSDVTAIGGLPPGEYEASIGGPVSLTPEGRLNLSGTEFLAGSASLLAAGVARAITMAGIPLCQALDMATRIPGQLTGGRGVIEPGAPADLVCFGWKPGDDELRIERVWVAGREVSVGALGGLP